MINKPPKIYAEWVNVLRGLKDREDDTKALILLKGGEFESKVGAVNERFAQKFADAIKFRIESARRNFQKINLINENTIVQALTGLRKEYEFLLEVVDIDIPDSIKKTLRELVVSASKESQRGLEASAENSNDGLGKLLYIVRNNKVSVE